MSISNISSKQNSKPLSSDSQNTVLDDSLNQKNHVSTISDTDLQNKWFGTTSNQILWEVYNGDAQDVLTRLEANTFDCVITSPPYFWLRDYEVEGQIGLENSIDDYVEAIVSVMEKVYHALKPTGLLFLNLGDTYYSGKGKAQGVDKKSKKRRFGLRAVDKSGGLGIGLKPKTLIGIPWRVAITMCESQWILRSPIVWHRQYSLPESVHDRPRRSYEYIFMFAKQRKYFFNRTPFIEASAEDMWNIPTQPENSELNTAPFPDELVRRCLEIGCPPGGLVLDPFAGSGTTLRVALGSNRPATGIDLNLEFCLYIVERMKSL